MTGLGELRRDFHSTPDLFAITPSMPLLPQHKGSRSQEDVNLIYSQSGIIIFDIIHTYFISKFNTNFDKI